MWSWPEPQKLEKQKLLNSVSDIVPKCSFPTKRGHYKKKICKHTHFLKSPQIPWEPKVFILHDQTWIYENKKKEK